MTIHAFLWVCCVLNVWYSVVWCPIFLCCILLLKHEVDSVKKGMTSSLTQITQLFHLLTAAGAILTQNLTWHYASPITNPFPWELFQIPNEIWHRAAECWSIVVNNDAQENVFNCLEDISDRKKKSQSRRWERSAWKTGLVKRRCWCEATHTHIMFLEEKHSKFTSMMPGSCC